MWDALATITALWVWAIIGATLFWWTRRALVPLVLLVGAVVFHAVVLLAVLMGASVTVGTVAAGFALALAVMALMGWWLWCG